MDPSLGFRGHRLFPVSNALFHMDQYCELWTFNFTLVRVAYPGKAPSVLVWAHRRGLAPTLFVCYSPLCYSLQLDGGQ